jgi:signal transduction histidine kinase
MDQCYELLNKIDKEAASFVLSKRPQLIDDIRSLKVAALMLDNDTGLAVSQLFTDTLLNFAVIDLISLSAELREINKIVDESAIIGVEDGSAPTFNVADAIGKTLLSYELKARERGLELQPKLAHVASQLAGKAEDFAIALQNMIDNAVKYSAQMRKGRLAWISVRQYREVSGNLVVEVESWGSKIAEDELMRVQKAGERGAHANRPGMGLGLAIVHEKAAQLGGAFSIECALANKTQKESKSSKYITIARLTFAREKLH